MTYSSNTPIQILLRIERNVIRAGGDRHSPILRVLAVTRADSRLLAYHAGPSIRAKRAS